jgi:hypothetical protein
MPTKTKAGKKRKEPPTSEAQRRWAFAAEEKGELPKGKATEWSRKAKGKKLPAKKKAK